MGEEEGVWLNDGRWAGPPVIQSQQPARTASQNDVVPSGQQLASDLSVIPFATRYRLWRQSTQAGKAVTIPCEAHRGNTVFIIIKTSSLQSFGCLAASTE